MKTTLVVLAVVLAAAAGAAYWAWNSVDLLVRVALEHYGPEVTGARLRVGAIDISPRDGRGAVQNLELGSPAGFDAPYTVHVGEVRLAVDPATIAQPVVHVLEITVESPLITYERTDRGTNLDAIQKHIAGYIGRTGGASQARPAEAAHGPRRFVIDRLSLRGGKVKMTTPALRGQGVNFDLPDIELRDLGRREDGITASEAGNIVAVELQARIAQKVLTNIELLRKGGVEGAVDALKGLLR